MPPDQDWLNPLIASAGLAFVVWLNFHDGEAGLARGVPPLTRRDNPRAFWAVQIVFGLVALVALIGAGFALFRTLAYSP